MRNLGIFAALMLLTGLAIAQDVTRDPDPSANQARDLFSVARSDNSLSMFVTAVQSSGMAKMLREEGPLTVFALTNRAFANLPKKDLEALLSNHAAMHVLIAHYIAHGNIPQDDTAELLSARTLVGVKLRTDIRAEGSYVNGAKIDQSEIQCTNGIIHVLDRFDPGLVHEAIAVSNRAKN
jgi:transforming growth factor-beta-induced protein